MTIYKCSTVAHAERVDEGNINVVSENTECKAVDAADWKPNLCNNLEEMLPSDISKDHKEKTLALLELYADVIASSDSTLGRTGILRHSIDTGNATPIRQQVRRMSPEGQRTAQGHDREKGDLTIQKPMGFAHCACAEERWLNTVIGR